MMKKLNPNSKGELLPIGNIECLQSKTKGDAEVVGLFPLSGLLKVFIILTTILGMLNLFPNKWF